MRPESIPIAQRLSPSRVRSTKGAFSPQGSGGGGADGTFLGMKLAADQVRYVAQLARLGLSDAEMEAYSDELSKILDYVGQLSQLNTDAIPPTAQVGDLHDVLVADQLVGVPAVPLKVTALVPLVAPKLVPKTVTDRPTFTRVGDRLVMFGVTTSPHAPFKRAPPPNIMSVRALPCSSLGVWQSLHCAIRTRYQPCFTCSLASGARGGSISG